MINIRKLEAELWESADLLRQGSKLTSSQYCMPVLALLFLRYAYSRYKMVEAEILQGRPMRGGRVLPVEPSDFTAKSALFLPREAQFDYLVNLPDNIVSAGLKSKDGNDINSLGEAVNNAMQLVEDQSEQLTGVLPKTYTSFSDDILRELLRIFNNKTIDDVGGDVIGRIYEYFLSKFAKAVASDDGVFFTPKSLVKMLVNVLEPKQGVMLDPACGSGGMFVQTGDFVNQAGLNANTSMTFFGQEKVEYNAQLCLMNMAVHGLNGRIVSGDAANSFYHDAHNLEGKCDFVMANPPFNVDKVKAESAFTAGRLPFGLPGVNAKTKEIGNANYLWISYFYAYLNEHGRAGFVMASSATDSANKERDIREKLVRTGDVDVMVSVGNNFFYTLSLPCSLWFFDRNKNADIRDKVLFIDARNYYTVVDRTLNEWTEWQLRNLQAIVHLYRGEKEKYQQLIIDYDKAIKEAVAAVEEQGQPFSELIDRDTRGHFWGIMGWTKNSEEYSLLELNDRIIGQIKQTRTCVKVAEGNIEKRKVKAMRLAGESFCNVLAGIVAIINERLWLVSKFGEDGQYQDILGLCKIATIQEIEEKNYSLTPGAYVGVPEQEDDGVDFHERMNEIHAELAKLNKEANVLMGEIQKAWEELK
ncbi:type I restriction enzyme M protein [Bacteroidales bacterium KHT7]|nr:type I restriction enzyme M protein [Bacteroidales bacterium KHT7]